MKPHLALTLALLFLAAITAHAQSTAYTYQGHLMDAGASANGNYDIQFTLKNALTAGASVGRSRCSAVNSAATSSRAIRSRVISCSTRESSTK